MDRLLVLSLALAAGALLVVSPWAVAGLAVALGLLLRPRALALAAVAVALVVGWARCRGAVDAFREEELATDSRLPRLGQCSGIGTVDTSPVLTRGVVRLTVVFKALDCEGRAGPARTTLYGGPADAARGDEAFVIARLAPPDRFVNPELGPSLPSRARRGVTRTGSVIGWEAHARGRGPPAWIDRARAHVRARIEATFPSATAPMARALVLGETDLDSADDAAFRASGLSHLLAVSGMHLVLVVLGFVRLLRGALLQMGALAARFDVARLASAAGVPLAWAYADFAGSSGSARRAAWMLSAGLLSVALGRRSDAARAFALSLLLGALVDPLVTFDVSFVLSAAATGGLLSLGPRAQALVAGWPVWSRGIARSVSTTLSATVPCAPILATFAPTLPLAGVVANVVAVPVGELAALPLCLAHALLAPLPGAERGAALLGSGALATVLAFARASSAHGVVDVPRPTDVQLAALAFAFAASLLASGVRRRVALLVAAVALLLAEVQAIDSGQPRGVLRATFLDIAQGDSALVDLPDGSAMLIDGGGAVGSPLDVGSRVIGPVLRARRRDALALVVLSHPHPDHFGGLPSGLSRVRVAQAWDTGQGEREGVAGGYAQWLDAMRVQGTPIARPPEICGVHAFGGATIEVLSPCPSPLPDRAPNDNSLVLRVRYGRRAFLFVGDAEREEERTLLERPSLLRADVLKVGHHGSRTSTSPDFLAAVGPEFAVISCGRRNRYGHPAATTLATLANVRTLRTDESGAITATTDGESLEVRSAVDGLSPALYSPYP